MGGIQRKIKNYVRSKSSQRSIDSGDRPGRTVVGYREQSTLLWDTKHFFTFFDDDSQKKLLMREKINDVIKKRVIYFKLKADQTYEWITFKSVIFGWLSNSLQSILRGWPVDHSMLRYVLQSVRISRHPTLKDAAIDHVRRRLTFSIASTLKNAPKDGESTI